jgi:hypothetical protein
MKTNRFLAVALITFALTLNLTPSNAVTKYANCKAVNAVYPGGIAKSKSAKNMKMVGGKKILAISKYKPKVDANLYNQLKSLDRDADGIACEK